MKEIVYKSDVAYSEEAYAVLEANAKRYPLGTNIKKAAKAEQMTFTQFVRESIKAALERRESTEAK